MTNKNESKPNYTDSQILENTRGEASYLPDQYKGYTDSFYEKESESSAGSFLIGAVIGGVIGAATALFLAPKTGKEMREDLSSQAVQFKEKGIEISTVAKDKATEFSSVAKDKATEFSSAAKDKASEFSSVAKDKATEFSSVAKDKATEISSVAKDKASEFKTVAKDKTDEVTKSIQEQSAQVVEKVKTMTSKTSVPMDDGTASSEGEEAIEYIEKVIAEESPEKTADETAAAQAVKNAAEKIKKQK